MDNLQRFLIDNDELIPQAAANIEKLIAAKLPPVLIVVDNGGFLMGTITDGDIRRFIIKHNKSDAFVSNAMNKNCIRAKSNSEISISALKDLKVVPIIDSDQKVIDVLHENPDNNILSLSGINVVINAGGLGSRLYPYTKAYPKPLVPVNRIPMINHVIHSFSKYEIRDFKVILNHKKEMIKEYMLSNFQRINIESYDEDEPYGTVGGLSLVKEVSDTFVFTNCDILVDHDLSLIIDFHIKSLHKLTIVSSILTNTIPYGVLSINKNGVLESIKEKPTENYFVSTGIYIMESELIKEIPDNTRLDMDRFIKHLLDKEISVGIYPIEFDQWSDMGSIEGLVNTEKKMSGENE